MAYETTAMETEQRRIVGNGVPIPKAEQRQESQHSCAKPAKCEAKPLYGWYEVSKEGLSRGFMNWEEFSGPSPPLAPSVHNSGYYRAYTDPYRMQTTQGAPLADSGVGAPRSGTIGSDLLFLDMHLASLERNMIDLRPMAADLHQMLEEAREDLRKDQEEQRAATHQSEELAAPGFERGSNSDSSKSSMSD